MAVEPVAVPAVVRPFALGWFLALVIIIAVWLGVAFGRVDIPVALLVSAVCAVRL
jgi:hypothetical protein